jgi:hypothetical protein
MRAQCSLGNHRFNISSTRILAGICFVLKIKASAPRLSLSELNCNRSRSAPDSKELNENVKRFFPRSRHSSGLSRRAEKGRDNYGNNMLAPWQIIIAIAEKREIPSLCN